MGGETYCRQQSRHHQHNTTADVCCSCHLLPTGWTAGWTGGCGCVKFGDNDDHARIERQGPARQPPAVALVTTGCDLSLIDFFFLLLHLYLVSSKPKRCDYKQLAADEDNNNLIEDDDEEESEQQAAAAVAASGGAVSKKFVKSLSVGNNIGTAGSKMSKNQQSTVSSSSSCRKNSKNSKNGRRLGSIDDQISSTSSSDSGSAFSLFSSVAFQLQLDPNLNFFPTCSFVTTEDDDYDSEDEEQERIDRLTCWVCERYFSSSRILERHKIRERHFW